MLGSTLVADLADDRAHVMGMILGCAVQDVQMTDRNLIIRRGRHVGWWVQGRAGRGFLMFDWWPTKRLALMVARFWVRAAKRAGAGEVTIDVRDARD